MSHYKQQGPQNSPLQHTTIKADPESDGVVKVAHW